MKNRARKIICLILCTIFVSALIPITANADMGPKPSVRVTFENLGDTLCYGTLLSKNPSTGPSSVWNGIERDARHNENEYYEYETLNYENWKAFVEYEDSDGYYFLQEAWQINETKELAWTYYPPSSFKILLYYPQTGQFAVSDICERYAFDTYYTVDMDGIDIGSVDYDEKASNSDRLTAYKSYRWRGETLSLVARILITIAIEMGVALLFGFRERKAILLLVAVNTSTQIILNVLLNVINFNSGQSAFVVGYILIELAIFVIEAILYSAVMNKFTDTPKKTGFFVIYALVANAISFGAGIVVANLIPGIF